MKLIQLINIQQVKFSKKEFDNLQSEIIKYYDELIGKEVEIVSLTTNLREQKLDIGVYNLNEERKNILKDLFDENMINIIDSERNEYKSSKDHYRPVQGGLKIHYNPQTRLGCTAAYSALSTTTNQWFIVTAGHCLDNNDRNSWYQGNGQIGTKDRYLNSGSVDAGAILIDYNSFASNEIYAFDTPSYARYNAVAGASDTTEGDFVCSSHGNSDRTRCGEIINNNWMGTIGGVWKTNMIRVNFAGIGGDSGSPLFSFNGQGVKLLGILSGGSSSEDSFTKIHYVQQQLNIRPFIGY